MRFQRVCLELIGYCLPPQIVTSEEIERRLEPLYRRLRLPEGRLELITGVQQRRFWDPGTMSGMESHRAAKLALEAANWDPSSIGALVHGSVCRDFLEPATACSIHHRLGLPPSCVLFDLSNACLGLLSGALVIANMIELGQVKLPIRRDS